ncbi:HNH endonuclease [Sulfitobacter sp. OXR-159]|uniref:HNH endonuclease n=1 Tax=Sulfitobacter sp. OXR-159 TaxID=3100174 RepID=UPI002AC9AAE5|nr:HNH endonuclease [Sulfitobacter sp. OXR-159]WPZ30789.1 HNH endonuclease [Sulfitobacter sp. OXR-159]WPZ30890.1 HNH endonuclease [Sulfitobacter sp. OXR-159]
MSWRLMPQIWHITLPMGISCQVENTRWTADQTCKRWNTRYAQKEAFTALNKGYRYGRIFMKNHLAHRVIWAIVHDQWPDSEIDHIDRDRQNNRICNLRLATRSENAANQCMRSNNRSGFKGVTWSKVAKKWTAEISFNNKRNYLGLFETKEEAALAYKNASERLHKEFSGIMGR